MSYMKKNLKQKISEIKQKIDKLRKEKNRPIVIGIAGGSGSGKGYITKSLIKITNSDIISMDDYYIGIDRMKDRNFDSPKALDLKLLKEHIALFKNKKEVKKPVYDFATHKRIGYENCYSSASVIIVEGLFALNEILREELDIKIFIDSPIFTLYFVYKRMLVRL